MAGVERAPSQSPAPLPSFPTKPRSLIPTPFFISETVLPPISTEGITSSSEDIAALVEKTRLIMLDAIEDLAVRRAETNRLKAAFATKEDTGEEDEDGSETTPLVHSVGH